MGCFRLIKHNIQLFIAIYNALNQQTIFLSVRSRTIGARPPFSVCFSVLGASYYAYFKAQVGATMPTLIKLTHKQRFTSLENLTHQVCVYLRLFALEEQITRITYRPEEVLWIRSHNFKALVIINMKTTLYSYKQSLLESMKKSFIFMRQSVTDCLLHHRK